MIQSIIFTAVAGIAGTGLGGIISLVFMKKSTENMACWMLSFAGGVIVSIVCFGLMPEAFELAVIHGSFEFANVLVCTGGLIFGIIVIIVLNRIVDKITKEKNIKVHQNLKEFFHESHLVHNSKKMIHSGIMILIAIALHNIPEGIAIGAGGSHDYHLGFLLAFMIAAHNIPVGMAIASPLLIGGVSRIKVVLLTSLSGVSTLLGGLIGYFIGGISDLAIAISLSAAGGTMLYIVFGEMMPQAIIMAKNRAASIVSLLGIIVGLLVTQI